MSMGYAGGWTEERAAAWVRDQERHDRMLAPYGHRLLVAAGLRPGGLVVDVGCGTGGTTIDAANAVGGTGRAVGIDASAEMVAAANRRAAEAGVENVHFVHADAETHRFRRGKADVVMSRFGVHGFTDPVAAFAAMRAALVPGGRLCFTAWAGADDNGWWAVPRGFLAEPGTGMATPGDRRGPFAFADPARVEEVLAGAGYTDVRLERATDPVWVASDVDDAVAFFRAHAAAARPGVDGDALATAEAPLRAALEPFVGPDGVTLPGAAWIVTAVSTGP
jgi:SAM-dependent methyltransferase